MLACSAPKNLDTLPYPLLASVKLDGIRCIIKDGIAYSRTLRPIRNKHIQSILGRPEYNGLDGELIVGSPTAPDCMRRTNSGVMSIEGTPNFKYYVFDFWDRPGSQYREAYLALLTRGYGMGHIEVLPQYSLKNPNEVETSENSAIMAGYEGLILRRPDSPYKFGRSTASEGYLFKLKRYLQEEAVVIGYAPLQHNDNNAEINALGYTQRSSAQDGKVDLPLLGNLIVKGMFQDQHNVTFSIGTGFTLLEREKLWEQREDLIGKIVTYKFFPTGSKDKPRHPVFKSFRDPEDI